MADTKKAPTAKYQGSKNENTKEDTNVSNKTEEIAPVVTPEVALAAAETIVNTNVKTLNATAQALNKMVLGTSLNDFLDMDAGIYKNLVFTAALAAKGLTVEQFLGEMGFNAKRGPGRPPRVAVEGEEPRRGPGRPRKTEAAATPADAPKRGPGRPRKVEAAVAPAKRGPGRPRKNQ